MIQVNGTATIKYKVINKSSKSRQLMMLPMAGVSQTMPCVLMPKGTAGDTCFLELVVTGSALPAAGILGGPWLC